MPDAHTPVLKKAIAPLFDKTTRNATPKQKDKESVQLGGRALACVSTRLKPLLAHMLFCLR